LSIEVFGFGIFAAPEGIIALSFELFGEVSH
jgi:hypothetical protein